MMDPLDLQRLLTALVMPLPVGLALVLLGLGAAARRGARRAWLGWTAALAGVALVWLAATPRVADAWMGWLEAGYPPRSPAHCPRADAVVVLGGAVYPQVAGDERARLADASDRVWEAARLYHAGCAPVLFVSAGGELRAPQVAGEGEAIARLLDDLGVPAAAVRMEVSSRNTQGNAAFTRQALTGQGVERVLLVSSAWHLRRAQALFEREGFTVLPWPADARGFTRCRGAHCWVPDAESLHRSALAWKETLGYWVQVGLR